MSLFRSSFAQSSLFGPKAKGAEGLAVVSLNLVALMDILSNLLFFLLASYGVTNAEIKGSSGMLLPVSSSEEAAQMSILVRVTLDDIKVEEKTVAKVREGAVDARFEEDKIVPLFDELRAVSEARTQATGDVEVTEEDTVLLLLADKRVDYSVVSQVLKTAGYAGYPNFRFAVVNQ